MASSASNFLDGAAGCFDRFACLNGELVGPDRQLLGHAAAGQELELLGLGIQQSGVLKALGIDRRPIFEMRELIEVDGAIDDLEVVLEAFLVRQALDEFE